MMPAPAPHTPDPSTGGRLVATDGQLLPLVGARLTATAKGGVAEVVLEQRFRNSGALPLTVTYSFPLPADAAVGGYAFTIGDRRIVGEIDRRQAARERFEQAILEGRTAGLVEQERSSLFTQEIGNIPPGAEVVAELTLDQRLRWLDEGSWEWRFPTTAAPRYLGASGRVPDAAQVAQEIAEGPLPARLTLALSIQDPYTGVAESPSHRVRAAGGAVSFPEDAGVPLDRDLVVRWPVARAAARTDLEVAWTKDNAHGLLTLVPPTRGTAGAALARDLIVLLDTSGSMDGEPLDQARRVVSALIDTLTDRDRLELIEFSSAPRRWKAEPVAATAAMRREALTWLGKLRASGGTEMREGILEALRPLRAESQRQIVLVTDGLIGFEQEVVGAIATRLPPSSRVHTVGVGSAVNRSLTAAAARAGHGLELLTGLGEDVERATRRLVARTDAPLVVDLVLSGSALLRHAPAALPDLFAGAPALVSLALRPEGGTLIARGRTAAGEWEETIAVPARAAGEGRGAIARLYGRERVEDLETRVATGEEQDVQIEQLGLAFQIATRLTSWVAISEERTVDPNAPSRRVRMPQELPQGMSVEGLGLRGATMPPMAAAGMMPTRMTMMAPAPMSAEAAPKTRGGPGFLSRAMGTLSKAFGGDADDGAADLDQEGAAEAERTFRGRIALRTGERLVVQFEVEGDDLDWEPPAEVELRWSDGRRLTVKVLQGTSAGVIRGGEGIRLVLELAAGQSPPDEVLVGTAPRILVRL